MTRSIRRLLLLALLLTTPGCFTPMLLEEAGLETETEHVLVPVPVQTITAYRAGRLYSFKVTYTDGADQTFTLSLPPEAPAGQPELREVPIAKQAGPGVEVVHNGDDIELYDARGLVAFVHIGRHEERERQVTSQGKPGMLLLLPFSLVADVITLPLALLSILVVPALL